MRINKISTCSSFKALIDDPRQRVLNMLREEENARQRERLGLPKKHIVPSDVKKLYHYPKHMKLELLDANINYFKKQPESKYNSKLIQSLSAIRSYLTDLHAEIHNPHTTLIV